MFRFKPQKKNDKVTRAKEEQYKIIHILLDRLSDSRGLFDVEAIWVISRLAYHFNADDALCNWVKADELQKDLGLLEGSGESNEDESNISKNNEVDIPEGSEAQ